MRHVLMAVVVAGFVVGCGQESAEAERGGIGPMHVGRDADECPRDWDGAPCPEDFRLRARCDDDGRAWGCTGAVEDGPERAFAWSYSDLPCECIDPDGYIDRSLPDCPLDTGFVDVYGDIDRSLPDRPLDTDFGGPPSPGVGGAP